MLRRRVFGSRQIMYKGNTRNKENVLYRGLTRLMSGPITKKRRQFYRREKRQDLDKYKFTSASGQPFKHYSKDMFLNMSAKFISEQQRAERYSDFEMMIYDPILSSALDIYADEITTSSMFQKLLKINCRNQEIKAILTELFYNILNVEANLFYWVKTMCKYGDFFLYLDIDEHKGVTNAIGLPGREVERMEGLDESNPNYVQFQWNSAGLTFENWQVAHFRVLSDDKYVPYGTSILDSARRIWRQYGLVKDAMMAYRIVRSAERRVFYLDVGNVPPEQVKQFVLDFQKNLKKNQVIDQDTGRVDLRYNALSVEEDYIIPVRGTSQTKIDTLPGGQYTGDVDDVKFLQTEMLAALKIPGSYIISNSENGSDDSSTLAQKDVRFSRTIQRLQRYAISELEKIGLVHLYTLGFRGDDLLDYSLELSNPSKIAELQELEHWRTKFDVASAATAGFFSKRWVAVNVFQLSEEEFIRNQREIFNDKKFELQLEQIIQMAETNMNQFGPTASKIGGEEDLEQEMTIEPPGEFDLEDEDDTLLAQPTEPAKRDDGSNKISIKKDVYGKEEHLTKNSKGKWYKPEDHDSRRSSGPRKRQTDSLWSRESSKNTKRTQPGRSLISLGLGITEEKEYLLEEEREIFTINENLTQINEDLENNKNDETQ